MSVGAGRLHRAVAVVLTSWASSGFAAGLIAQALRDLEAYLKAASSLVVQVATGLDKTEFGTLPPSARQEAAEEMRRLSADLTGIFLSQTSLVDNLEFYAKVARDPATTPAEREALWRSSVLDPARDIYASVDEVRRYVDAGALFSVALSDDDHRALGDNLMARGLVLRSFEAMPPPDSAEEVLQLEGVIAHYRILIENLRTLRGAVDAAQRRLKGA